jgi:hypothetical protein
MSAELQTLLVVALWAAGVGAMADALVGTLRLLGAGR